MERKLVFFLWFLVVLEYTFEISMNISNVIELWCTSMNDVLIPTELLFILLVNVVVMCFGSYLRCFASYLVNVDVLIPTELLWILQALAAE